MFHICTKFRENVSKRFKLSKEHNSIKNVFNLFTLPYDDMFVPSFTKNIQKGFRTIQGTLFLYKDFQRSIIP